LASPYEHPLNSALESWGGEVAATLFFGLSGFADFHAAVWFNSVLAKASACQHGKWQHGF